MGTTYQVRIPIQRLGTNCRTRGPLKGSTTEMSAYQHLWNGDIKVPRARVYSIRIRRLELLMCADHVPAACLRLCSEFSKAVVVVRDGSRFVEDSRRADLMRLVNRHRQYSMRSQSATAHTQAVIESSCSWSASLGLASLGQTLT